MQVRRAADEAGGRALLRMENTDIGRCRPTFEAGILEDLAWLGLEWDGEVRFQADHFEDYAGVVDQLRSRDLVYRCFLSRSKIAELTGDDPDAPFTSGPLPADEESERLSRGDAFAWRLSLSRAKDALGPLYRDLEFVIETSDGVEPMKAQPERFGDIALTRKDSPAAYHLAACHDDALQGVTHVIRGMDLVDAPHIQIVLQALMRWPTPRYRHHKLLTGPDGRRLAKRDRSKTIAAMRDEGMTPDDVRRLAAAP